MVGASKKWRTNGIPTTTNYTKDDEEDLRGPTSTQIVVYQDQKFVKTDAVFKTPEAKMTKKQQRKTI